MGPGLLKLKEKSDVEKLRKGKNKICTVKEKIEDGRDRKEKTRREKKELSLKKEKNKE